MAAKKYTFYKVEFVNWSEYYDYVICRDLNGVLVYLKLAESDFGTDPNEGDTPTSATITGIAMTEKQYQNWIKENQP